MNVHLHDAPGQGRTQLSPSVSWAVARWVMRSSPLNLTQKAVAIVLLSHADGDWAAWPSVASIAREASLSVRRTKAALSELEGLGLIDRLPRRRPSGRFGVTLYLLVGMARMAGVEADYVRPDASPTVPPTVGALEPQGLRASAATSAPDQVHDVPLDQVHDVHPVTEPESLEPQGLEGRFGGAERIQSSERYQKKTTEESSHRRTRRRGRPEPSPRWEREEVEETVEAIANRMERWREVRKHGAALRADVRRRVLLLGPQKAWELWEQVEADQWGADGEPLGAHPGEWFELAREASRELRATWYPGEESPMLGWAG